MAVWIISLCATVVVAQSMSAFMIQAPEHLTVAHAGNESVNGVFVLNGTLNGAPKYTQMPSVFAATRTSELWEIFCYESTYYIGVYGVVALYTADCASDSPPGSGSWRTNTAGTQPPPSVSATEGTLVACKPPLVKNCTCPSCVADWGAAGCPDLHSIAPDLIRPPMEVGVAPAAGRRVKQVQMQYAQTQAYHALYLPTNWQPHKKYPLIVEYMGNGPWSDGHGDNSTGRPEDSNLGYGISNGADYIWISMPFLTSDLGANTQISTYWWGCPEVIAHQDCGSAYNITPTTDYTKRTIQDAVTMYGADSDNIVLTGWSRGAIACGAIGLLDDEMSKLWKAFIPYSHLDGDCGVQPWNAVNLVKDRYGRLDGRPQLSIAECNVATQMGVDYLNTLNITGNFTFMTTGFQNHNDQWVLRPSKGRDRMRAWLKSIIGV